MLHQATLAVLIIVYLKKVWKPFILRDKSIICMITYLAVFNIINSEVKLKLYWIVFLEEIIFRGLLLQDVERTELNNLLSAVVFGCYQMIYIHTIGIFIFAVIVGYVLCLGARVMSVYELAMLRTIFYLLFL
jgi:membrane protease YdiL (CAAX protease family)